MVQTVELGTEDFIVSQLPMRRPLRCRHHDGPQMIPGYGHNCIYRFFDADGRLLYVGITWNIQYRWNKHRRKDWWPQVRRARVTCFRGRTPDEAQRLVRELEIEAIVTENPVYNVARPAVRA